jgi:Nuclease-related domain
LKNLLGLPLWVWVLLALGALAALFVFVRDRLRQARARRAIDNVISSVAYDELRNVLLPTGTGEQIHVHYVLLTQRGLLVIDLFDVQGMVFAGDKMLQWSVFGPKRHFTFTNPLPMLEERVSAVRHLAGDVPVVGRVVFSIRGEFPKGRPDRVLRLDALHDEFPVVDRSQGGVAAALAPVWERVRQAAQPNPLAR